MPIITRAHQLTTKYLSFETVFSNCSFLKWAELCAQMFVGEQKYISTENGERSNVISKITKEESKMSSLQHKVFPGDQSSGY